MASSQERPVFSRQQVEHYFDRLRTAPAQRIYHVAELKPEDAYRYLALLQKHHLVEVPFENLALHYSPHRQVSLHPEELFKKIISDNKGRGGYCMENNRLFGILLYTLGFNIYSAGARVFDNGVWSGWGHMINIVTIGDSRYHVDVGFGGNGPIQPMKLDRSGTVEQHIHPATCRLQWRSIDANTDFSQRLWVFEHRMDEESAFQTIYCFTELEFLPSDYKVMNYYTSSSGTTFFTRVIIGEKKILGEDGKIAGNLILGNNDLKWRMHGAKTKEIKFESEDDRVQALEEHFGIRLSRAERDGIVGLPSEIK